MTNANTRHASWSPLLAAVFLVWVGFHPARANAAPCASLASLTLPDTTITSPSPVAAGMFSLPEGVGAATGTNPFADLPAFCRVTASLHPSSDSDIRVEVWLPATGWNGNYEAVGNGGWGGVISYTALAQAIRHGYAASSTDTGHTGNRGIFALGHPEKLVDFSYRAVHEMTVQAKVIIGSYYGRSPTLSFWAGCSLGGHQGIAEAGKYPADFDAVVAGSPALNWTRLHVARLAINAVAHRSKDSYIPPAKYTMIHDAALQACDALDGVKDGVIEDPARCHFDPKVLACKGSDGPGCLTALQVETARALYAPVKNPRTGLDVEPALLQPGSELGWATLAGAEPLGIALDAFKYVIFKDPDWDWHRFNPATDIDRALAIDNGLIDFTDASLKPFFLRGGKLLMYHGWADPQVTPMGSVDYFNEVTKKLGQAVVDKSMRLYMVPGMNHCQGGPGTDTFDKMAAIEQWVEAGKVPDQIIASHRTNSVVDRTRPLCPYPQTAQYKGSGSTDDAASFVCKLR
jgi:feruloyl esterase